MRDLLGVNIICLDVVNEHQTDVPFLMYDGKKIPYEDNTFDAVLLIYTLHHCDDPIEVLKEARRVSKGKIIIFEDTYTNFFNKLLAKIFDYYSNKKYNPKVKNLLCLKEKRNGLRYFKI
jgi:ubiquinone/menaquinone biosynthesis C-methylase UbiE